MTLTDVTQLYRHWCDCPNTSKNYIGGSNCVVLCYGPVCAYMCLDISGSPIESWHIEAEKNGRHFPDDIFKCISFNENVWIPIQISLKLVPKGPINNIPALVGIMAWRRPGDKPLSEPMMAGFPTHICVTRPQWVNWAPWNIHGNLTALCTFWSILSKPSMILRLPQCLRVNHEENGIMISRYSAANWHNHDKEISYMFYPN